MTRKFTFLLMALLALAGFKSWGQTTEVQIGTGTSSSNNLPFNSYYYHSYAEMLYTASEIKTAAPVIQTGGTITEIKFNVTGATSKQFELYIYMKNVDKSSYANGSDFVTVNSSDEVWHGTRTFSTGGWVTFTLDKPFEYDATKNLLIAFNDRTGGSYAPASFAQTEMGNIMGIYSASDYTDINPENPTSVGTTGYPWGNLRPNIKINITLTGLASHTITYVQPDNGTVSGPAEAYEGQTVTLTATPDENYALEHFIVNGTPITGNTFTMPESDVTVSATFFAFAPATIPYNCGFEDAIENGNWRYANGTTYKNKWYIGTGTKNGGIKSLYISSDNGTSNTYTSGSSYVYAYREIDFETAGDYTISFDWKARGESGCYDAMYAALVPSGTACPPTSNITGNNNYLPSGYINVGDVSQSSDPAGVFLWTNDASGWKSSNKTINISATGTYTLVFYWKNDGSDGTNPPAAVDNIGIKALTCYVPTAFATPNVTATGATLSWTAGGSETDWVIEYGTASDFSGATSVNVSDTPTTTLTGLAAGTKYYARIKSDCGGGDESYWSNAISFTTECVAIDLSNMDFSENFDDCTAGNNVLPDCWNYINTTTYSSYAIYPMVTADGYYSTYAYSAPNCLYLYSYASSYYSYDPQPQYAILPNMVNLAGKQVTLRAKGYDANSTFKIGTMNNPTDASTFTAIATQTLTTSYQEYTFIIPAGTTDNHVVIMIDAASSSRTNNGAYIDDITITDVPTCLKPVELAYSDVTAHTAQMSWTNGEEGQTAWQIWLNDDSHIIDVTENPYTLTGLDPETAYTVKVRANCGEGDYSDWSDPVNFTTAIACPAPTDLAVAPGSYSAEVSWSGSSESYNVQYRTARYVDGLEENFASFSTPSGWENKSGLLSGVMAGTTELSDNSQWNFSASNGVFNNHAYINIYGSSRYGWLVTPSVTVKSGDDLDFDLALTAYSGTGTAPTGTCSDDRFVVLITTDNMESWTILREWNNSGSDYVYNSIATAGEAVSIDLSAYVGQAVKIAFYGESTVNGNGDNNLHIDNVVVGPVYEAGLWHTVTVDETTATLPGLDTETKYDVKVQGNCGDEGMSVETDIITFTTFTDCPTPTDLAVSNLTQNTADLDWTGASDVESYVVKYRTAEQINGISEEFDTSFIPEDWSQYSGLLSGVMAGTTDFTEGYQWNFSASNGVFDNHAYINIYGDSRCGWLVTPSMTVKSGDDLDFDLALTAYSGTGTAPTGTCSDDRFVVLITTNDMVDWIILREWNNSGSDYVYNSIATAGEAISIDLSAYVGQVVKIAFYGESTVSGNGDNNLHIDNVAIGTPVAAGEWQEVSDADKPYHFTGLTAGTKYDVQVMSGCATDDWSEMFSFKTLFQGNKVFVTEGGWSNGDNWIPAGAPAISDEVIIRANAQIENGTVAAAKKITFEGTTTPTLTILDGGQLQTNNDANAIVKKNIMGYSENPNYDEETYNNANYYLIGSPLSYTIYNSDISSTGILSGTYDLYSWEYSASDDLEWRNYENSSFNISRGTAYLYANKDNNSLSFTGNIPANNTVYSKTLNYSTSDTYTFNGWNLVSNPFVCNAYVLNSEGTAYQPYYKMNADGNGFESVTGEAIAPMEGIFVQATESGQSVKFSREQLPENGNGAKLNIMLSNNMTRGNAVVDNAILCFGNESTLEKFSFREGSSKIYIPQDNKDYAVVGVEPMGEIPVSFKAEKNGSYTITVNTENVEAQYLHLIDNMTGADVDLLSSPSYTFNASTSDYAYRFKLVFNVTMDDANEGNDGMGSSFAYISNGELIISNEGRATLQVIDVMGRIISSEEINGEARISTNGLTAGVYVLNLNGNVQKIVVR